VNTNIEIVLAGGCSFCYVTSGCPRFEQTHRQEFCVSRVSAPSRNRTEWVHFMAMG